MIWESVSAEECFSGALVCAVSVSMGTQVFQYWGPINTLIPSQPFTLVSRPHTLEIILVLFLILLQVFFLNKCNCKQIQILFFFLCWSKDNQGMVCPIPSYCSFKILHVKSLSHSCVTVNTRIYQKKRTQIFFAFCDAADLTPLAPAPAPARACVLALVLCTPLT